MNGRLEKVYASPTVPVTDREVLRLAELAYGHSDTVLRYASEFEMNDIETLRKAAVLLWMRNCNNRGVLTQLLMLLQKVPRVSIERLALQSEKDALLVRRKEGRKVLAEIAQLHPLIGSTQVVGYRVPGANIRWGTKRKPR